MQTKHLYFLTTNTEYSTRNGKKLSAWWRCWEWLIDCFRATRVYVHSFAILKVARCTEIFKDYVPAESVAHISESGRIKEDCIRRWLHTSTNTESRNTAGLSGIRVICSSFRITSPSSIVSISEIIPCSEQRILKTQTRRSKQQQAVSWLDRRIMRTFLRKKDSKGKENRNQTSETERTWRKGAGFFADDFNSDVEENEDLEDDENFPSRFCGVKWAQPVSTCVWTKCQICGKWLHALYVGEKGRKQFISGWCLWSEFSPPCNRNCFIS